MPVQSQTAEFDRKVAAWQKAALTKYQHNAADLHLIGETIGPPSLVRSLSALNTAAVGISPYPAREDHVHAMPDWGPMTQTYTPVMTATTTNPTQGTGGTAGGIYIQIGKWVYGTCQWTFGTAGTAFGAGNYEINLPVTPKNWVGTGGMTVQMILGTVWLNGGAGGIFIGVPRMVTSPRVRFVSNGTATVGATPTTPFTFANSTGIFMTFMYEAA